MVSSFGDTCERILCCAEVGEAFLELFAEDFSALIKPCTLNRSGGWNGEQLCDPQMLGAKPAREAVIQRE